jgi:hypothetical protein
MTFTQRLWIVPMTIAFVLWAAWASPQTPPPPVHDHERAAQVPPGPDLAAKIASLDARIAVLRADMMMFVGELKITAMAALIDALVERQVLTDEQMRSMHGRMHDRMRNRMEVGDAPAPPKELAAETLCSPFI